MKKFFASFFIGLLFILQPLIVSASHESTQFTHQAEVDLNVRYQPKMGNNRIDHIKKGQRIKVKKVLRNWCQIEYKKYRSAYVYCPYLKKITVSQTKVINTTPPVLKSPPAVPKKGLSAVAIKVKDYNNELVSIRNEAVRKIMSLFAGSIENDFGEKILPLFPKIGVIFKDAVEASSLKDAPSEAKALLEAVKAIYDIDSQIVDKVITTYNDSTIDESYELFGELTSDLVKKEREAIDNYNKIKNQLAEKYGIDVNDMMSISN